MSDEYKTMNVIVGLDKKCIYNNMSNRNFSQLVVNGKNNKIFEDCIIDIIDDEVYYVWQIYMHKNSLVIRSFQYDTKQGELPVNNYWGKKQDIEVLKRAASILLIY